MLDTEYLSRPKKEILKYAGGSNPIYGGKQSIGKTANRRGHRL